tara:strand:+ start:125 stop:334 length:210 start_codon:yes stop_codon:yes gene_type:complete
MSNRIKVLATIAERLGDKGDGTTQEICGAIEDTGACHGIKCCDCPFETEKTITEAADALKALEVTYEKR